MTAAQWATFLTERADKHKPLTLWGNDCHELAALLRRAARVEEAARNVLAAADLCDYWYEQDIAPLRAALEGGERDQEEVLDEMMEEMREVYGNMKRRVLGKIKEAK